MLHFVSKLQLQHIPWIIRMGQVYHSNSNMRFSVFLAKNVVKGGGSEPTQAQQLPQGFREVRKKGKQTNFHFLFSYKRRKNHHSPWLRT